MREKCKNLVNLLASICMMLSMVIMSTPKANRVSAAKSYRDITFTKVVCLARLVYIAGYGLNLGEARFDLHNMLTTENKKKFTKYSPAFCGQAFSYEPGYALDSYNSGSNKTVSVSYASPEKIDDAMVRKILYYGGAAHSFGLEDKLATQIRHGGWNGVIEGVGANVSQFNYGSTNPDRSANEASAALTNDLISIARHGGDCTPAGFNGRDNANGTGSVMAWSASYFLQTSYGINASFGQVYMKTLDKAYSYIRGLADPQQWGYDAYFLDSYNQDTRIAPPASQVLSVTAYGSSIVRREPQNLYFLAWKAVEKKPKYAEVTGTANGTASATFTSNIYKKEKSNSPVAGQKVNIHITHGSEARTGYLTSDIRGKFNFDNLAGMNFSKTFNPSKTYTESYCTNASELTTKQKQQVVDAGYYLSRDEAQAAANRKAQADVDSQKATWYNQPFNVTVKEKKEQVKSGYYVPSVEPTMTFQGKVSDRNKTLDIGSQTYVSGTGNGWVVNKNTIINTPAGDVRKVSLSDTRNIYAKLTGELKKVTDNNQPLANAEVHVAYYDDYERNTGKVDLGVMVSGADGVFRPKSGSYSGNKTLTVNGSSLSYDVHKKFDATSSEMVYVANYNAISKEQEDWLKQTYKDHFFKTKGEAEAKAREEAASKASKLRDDYLKTGKHGFIISEIKAPKGYKISSDSTITVPLAKALANDQALVKAEIPSAKSKIINKPTDDTLNLPRTIKVSTTITANVDKVDSKTEEKLSGGSFEVWVNKSGKDANLTKIATLPATNGKISGTWTIEETGIVVNSGEFKYLKNIDWNSLTQEQKDAYTRQGYYKDEATARAEANKALDKKAQAKQAEYESVARRVEVREVTAPSGYKIVGEGKVGQTITVNHTVTGKIKNDSNDALLVTKEDPDGKKISGAKLKISLNGKDLETWTTDTSAHEVLGLKANTTYTITEIQYPEGYVKPITNTKTFTTGAIGAKNETKIINSYVSVSKQDFGGKELSGAKFEVREKANNALVDSWTSNGTPHKVKGLIEGKQYTIKETQAPAGYTIAEEITFTASATKNDKFVFKNSVTSIRKNDTNGNRLAGAVLQVKTPAGTVIDEWTTKANEDHIVSGLAVGKTYIIHEKSAPAGYSVADDITIVPKGKISPEPFTMVDTNFTISKKELGGNKEIVGAHLQVLDSTGKVVEEWDTNGQPRALKNVRIGQTYTLRETKVPEGYMKSEDIKFTPTASNKSATMYDAYVEALKTNVAGQAIAGASLKVVDLSGVVKDQWVSTTEPHKIKNLTAGQKYKLMEVSAPTGYVKTTTAVDFTATATGTPVKLTLPNNTVSVGKKDLNARYLSGAKLQVIDPVTNGAVDTWTTDQKDHQVVGLIEGKEYILKELQAPTGYSKAKPKKFIAGENKKDVSVTMTDAQDKFIKKDLQGNALAGARIQIIRKSDKTVVDDWTSTADSHPITGLQAGEVYTIHEVSAPDGYTLAPDKDFTASDNGTTLDMIDASITMTKVDSANRAITGAKMAILDASGKEIQTWTSSGTPYKPKNLRVGVTYILREKEAPAGYTKANDITFTVESKAQTITMKDTVTSVIKKTTDGKVLAGAVMKVTDKASGTTVDTWTSGTTSHRVNGLVIGRTYTITEVTAPKGYGIAPAKDFVAGAGDKDNEYTITDSKTTVIKKDMSGKVLPGATLQVLDKETKAVKDEWVSTSEVHAVENLVVGRKYILHEKKAPDGYALADDIEFEFTPTDQELVMVDVQTTVLKVDSKGTSLPGAHLQVLDASGNVVDDWVSDTKEHGVRGLHIGQTYTLREISAPKGYTIAPDQQFTATTTALKLRMTDTVVSVSKKDVAGKEIEGASMKVTDMTGKVIDQWTSGKTEHRVEGLTQGQKYKIIESLAPIGYTLANEIVFTAGTTDMHFDVVDTVTKVSKQDVAGKEIEGAKLKVTEKDTGKVVDEWTSTTTPHNVKGLIIGKKYILHEDLAPIGYTIASDIEFTAGKDDKDQTVKMVDTMTEVSKQDVAGKEIEGAKLKVTEKGTTNVVDEWTSTTTPHKVKGLIIGKTYTLHEDLAPIGYTIASDIDFVAGKNDTNQTVKMVDTITKVIKKDFKGQPLTGAKLKVIDKLTNKVMDEWTSTDTTHNVKNLVATRVYILHEDLAPAGYNKAIDIEFTAGTEQTIIMVDTITEIKKRDVSGKGLAGAKLQIIDKATGKVMDEWVSEATPHKAKNLQIGNKYILHEVLAPKGYTIAKDIEFTAEAKDHTIEMIDTQSFLKKVDVGGKEVEGAKIQVLDKDNNVVDEWISTTEDHAIENLRAGEEYTIHEEVAPDGYVYASDFKFTAGEVDNHHYEMVDTIQTVVKQDEHGKMVKGAKLKLVDKETGDVVDEWISGQQIVNLTKMQTAQLDMGMDVVFTKDGVEYKVLASTKMEVKQANPKEVNKPAEEEKKDDQEEAKKDDQEEAKKDEQEEVKKEDQEGQEETDKGEDEEQANEGVEYQYQLTVTKEDGKKEYYYIDSTGAEAGHRVSNTYVLKDYEVVEESAPKGYVKALNINITPSDEADMTDNMIDKQVKFTKVDITGDEIEGAKIKVVDEEDKVVDEWISEKTPHEIENLEIGKKYKLIEEITPNGYTQASAIDFEMTEEGLDTHYKMVDAIHRIIKVDENGNTVKNARIAVYSKDKKSKIDEWVTGQHIVDLPIEKILEAKLAGEAKLDEHEAIATIKEDAVNEMKGNIDNALALAFPELDLVPESEAEKLANPEPAKTEGDEKDEEGKDEEVVYTAEDYIRMSFEGLNITSEELEELVKTVMEKVEKVSETKDNNVAEDLRQELYGMVDEEVVKANEVIETTTKDLTGLYLRINDQSAGGYTLVTINKDGTMAYTDIDEFGDEANHRISGMVAGEEYILKEVQSPTGFQLAPEMVFEADPFTDLKMTMIDRAIVEIATGVRIKPTTYVLIATISLFTLFTLSGYFLHRKRVNASR